jgi:hypothetical protein
MLAAVVPNFMLPKQVSQLIRDGRPDMSPPPGEEQNEMLASVPSGRAGGGGIPTLSGDMNRSDSSWRQIAPRPNPNGVGGATPGGSLMNDADGMDDETFAQFLKASEMEHEKQMQLRKLEADTRAKLEEDQAVVDFQSKMRASAKHSAHGASSGASASPPSLVVHPPSMSEKVGSDCEGSRTSREDGSHSHSRKSPHPPRPTSSMDEREKEERVQRAMAEFRLPQDVSEEEKAQIRAVLKMSIEAGAQ